MTSEEKQATVDKISSLVDVELDAIEERLVLLKGEIVILHLRQKRLQKLLEKMEE